MVHNIDPIVREQSVLDRLLAEVDRLEAAESQRIDSLLRESATDLTERDDRIAHHGRARARLRGARYGLLFGAVETDAGESFRIGRIGLPDPDGGPRLLVDWRAPISRAFYTATPLHREGLRERTRITSTSTTITGVYPEPLILGEASGEARGVDGALMAALEQPRTAHMGDIVGTIQREQDTIIRAPLSGTLVVQGGPGTGKTAVALHRAAYLLYEHRERLEKRVVLILGPNEVFLDYIGQVLPSLGEDSAVLRTAGTLVPGIEATAQDAPGMAAVKGDLDMVPALQKLVSWYQVSAQAAAASRLDRATLGRLRSRIRRQGLPHNEARTRFESGYIGEIIRAEDAELGENVAALSDARERRAEWAQDPEVRAEVAALWPILDPVKVLERWYANPRALAAALPDLSEDVLARLAREPGGELTPADVILIDELHEILGVDPRPAARAREQARRAREREIAYAHGVMDMLSDTTTDSDSGAMFGAEALADRQAEVDERSPAERAAADRGWTYGHVIVDEAQEVSPMLLRALLRRCPSRSFTFVGDAHQFTASEEPFEWEGLLGPQIPQWTAHELTVNYRTPAPIMALATRALREIRPDLSEPASVREGEFAPEIIWVSEARLLEESVARAEAMRAYPGTVAVVAPRHMVPSLRARLGEEIWVGDGDAAKGLEFDSVIVPVVPIGAEGPHGAEWARLYVALSRSTQRLSVVTAEEYRTQLPWLDADHAGSGRIDPRQVKKSR